MLLVFWHCIVQPQKHYKWELPVVISFIVHNVIKNKDTKQLIVMKNYSRSETSDFINTCNSNTTTTINNDASSVENNKTTRKNGAALKSIKESKI